ncbi:heterogeneous nuclear ribonucleoprotein U-like protein 2 [Lampris incognitus]|uniref:heterogeneous nuclear ribonucleoprotein U-like protein 2 n=1 Tax=Lampris incognitus TaxID=2546036 RepID=UPI0024B53FBC|nr:heterogeneous nuclear ribonucleoprotein U-like protein 2 [Lampris incognitus]
MRLTELKKYKVAELRARLRELGLDTKGLKAELVERLWTAWEETQDQERRAASCDGDVSIPQNDRPPPTPPTVQVSSVLQQVTSSASPPGTVGRPPPAREYTDSATQTDPDAGAVTEVSAQHGDAGTVTGVSAQHGDAGTDTEVSAQHGGAGTDTELSAQHGDAGTDTEVSAQHGDSGTDTEVSAQHGGAGTDTEVSTEHGDAGTDTEVSAQHGDSGTDTELSAQHGDAGTVTEVSAQHGEAGTVTGASAQHGDAGTDTEVSAQHGDAGTDTEVSAQRGGGKRVGPPDDADSAAGYLTDRAYGTCRGREPHVEQKPATCTDTGRAPGLRDRNGPDHRGTPEAPPVPRQAPQREEQKSAAGQGKEPDTAEAGGGTCPREKVMCRAGRAFYEFKEEIRYKRARSPLPVQESEEVEEEVREGVRLDHRFSDLHFEVSPDGSCGWPRFWARFPLLWSGCRLTHGVRHGSVGFEVRLDRKLPPAELGGPAGSESYGLRVGWSVADSSLLLGEEDLSYAYDGRGKKVSGGKEEDFGEPLVESDIIGCYVVFSNSGAAEVSFHRNGRSMGTAFRPSASVLQGCALYPHVLCKSCSVRFHLYPTDPPWYPSPPAFTPLAALPAGDRLRAPPAPFSKRQCEVVMMVGLPGSGKSHWARAYMQQHPEKHFKLLGTEALLACMISGGPRDSQLQQASQCLTELIKMAANTTGNYILDQTNVLFSARSFKLQLFRGFRRVVVVVFPSTEEWNRRLAQHQTRDEDRIPESALLRLQVSCSLPEQQTELLEELHYVELPQEQAQVLLQVHREKARSLLPPIPKYEKKKPYLRKNRLKPYGPPPFHTSHTTGRSGWTGVRFNKQLWEPQPRYWNSGYQDQGCYHNRAFGYSGYQGY